MWAVTLAGPNGPGGKAMPLDPHEDPAGNTAVRPGHGGRLLARVLQKDEQALTPVELLAMPHFATCGRDTTPQRHPDADPVLSGLAQCPADPDRCGPLQGGAEGVAAHLRTVHPERSRT